MLRKSNDSSGSATPQVSYENGTYDGIVGVVVGLVTLAGITIFRHDLAAKRPAGIAIDLAGGGMAWTQGGTTFMISAFPDARS